MESERAARGRKPLGSSLQRRKTGSGLFSPPCVIISGRTTFGLSLSILVCTQMQATAGRDQAGFAVRDQRHHTLAQQQMCTSNQLEGLSLPAFRRRPARPSPLSAKAQATGKQPTVSNRAHFSDNLTSHESR